MTDEEEDTYLLKSDGAVRKLLMPGTGIAGTQIPAWAMVMGALLCIGTTVSTSNRSTEVTFPCILSATVCLIAAGHYMLLVQLRTNTLNHTALSLLSRMTKLSYAEVAAAEKVGEFKVVLQNEFRKMDARSKIALKRMEKYNLARAGLMDFLADTIRFSDWLFTLPLLTIELWMLGSCHLGPEGRPLPGLDKWDAAALSIGTVVGGAIFRVAFDADAKSAKTLKFFVAWLVFWGGAAVMFALVCFILVGGLASQVDGSAASHDVAAVMTFQLIQVGYPIVSAVDFVARQFFPVTKDDPDHTLDMRSGLKDTCYGVLDVGSKAFFAIYVAFRVTWYPAVVDTQCPTAAAINNTLVG